jgi:hypothetical protein
MKGKRLASVDVLRAVAILLMIQVHFVENLSARDSASVALYDISIILGAFSAPIFTFLVGLSLWLWHRARPLQGREASKILARRGLSLCGSGLAFAVLIWLPKEVFSWDILTLIGASTLILLPLRKLPAWVLVGLAVVVLLVSPPLRDISGYELHWVHGEYTYRFTMRDVFLGFLLHGYFPLLPWVVFPILGYAVGTHFFSNDEPGEGATGWGLPVIGLVLAVLAGVGAIVSQGVSGLVRWYADGLTFYPASTTFVVGEVGLIVLGMWLLVRWLDRGIGVAKGAVLPFFERYSRYSLSAYVVHHAVHVWPIVLMAVLEGRRDVWWYYADTVSTPVALFLAAVFVAVFYIVLVIWDRKSWYGLETALRWLSEP